MKEELNWEIGIKVTENNINEVCKKIKEFFTEKKTIVDITDYIDTDAVGVNFMQQIEHVEYKSTDILKVDEIFIDKNDGLKTFCNLSLIYCDKNTHFGLCVLYDNIVTIVDNTIIFDYGKCLDSSTNIVFNFKIIFKVFN